MVVWLKPCESRSSPGFIPKNPAAHAAGFFLCAFSDTRDCARHAPRTTRRRADRWSAAHRDDVAVHLEYPCRATLGPTGRADRWSAARRNGVAEYVEYPRRAALDPTGRADRWSAARRNGAAVYVEYPCRAALDPTGRADRWSACTSSPRRHVVTVHAECVYRAWLGSTAPCGSRMKTYEQPTNGRLYPRVWQLSRPTVGSTPRRCHRAADQRSALPPGSWPNKNGALVGAVLLCQLLPAPCAGQPR